MGTRTTPRHPDTDTLLYEREQWNRLYHEQGRRIVSLEDALRDLLALAERVGQSIEPANSAVVTARDLLRTSE